MVDFSAAIDEETLARLGVEKGSRRLIDIEGRAAVLSQLEGREYAISAGGSLSNTLMALARLGDASAAASGEAPLRVGMVGLVGSDPLGAYYAAQMRQAGVEVCSPAAAGANTGTVVVLTSPDAQRTMLSYLGTAAEVPVDAALEAAISRSRLLVIEGYLWELPHAARTISAAIAAAQRAGCVVAMTAGDAGVVERHHADMWAAIDQGIDLLFTNASEAAALLRYEPAFDLTAPAEPATPGGAGGAHCAAGEQLALRLGPHCSVVIVTDGDRGSYVTALGQLHCVPPCWTEAAPVDTCGAGDAYAAGLLIGYLKHYDLTAMGRTAARTASAVISRHGAALTSEAAAALAASLPALAGKGGDARRSPSAAALAPLTPRVSP
ncbi:adenosine kinase [Micractinium conductrix]|uniref:Adenosine kinase n=1 Tax=Micractinium conductrix TaxID=554055 RepID=A0A2P6VB41_9CHLO|nr:adenosine kinase [Micractinium conductrix]|eukprot:PSC71317.1 adenosine kinase [Micractinium conductrix]